MNLKISKTTLWIIKHNNIIYKKMYFRSDTDARTFLIKSNPSVSMWIEVKQNILTTKYGPDADSYELIELEPFLKTTIIN